MLRSVDFQPHHRDVVGIGVGGDRAAKRVADLLQARRRGHRIPAVPQKLHHLPAHLQFGEIAVQIDPIQTLQIEAHVPVEHIVDRDRVDPHQTRRLRRLGRDESRLVCGFAVSASPVATGFVRVGDMRARLARSDRPNRIFEVTLAAARAAGLVGRKRVLDSTPLYDAVATMDTVTLIRSAIRGLLAAAGTDLERELRGLLRRDDDYAAAGKPVCDYDDPAAREGLVNALACDAMALVGALDGRELGAEVDNAARLLATVVGQDLDHDGAGVFRIARRVAKDRVISTVDPDARHGHKTSARGFDGYKGHLALDPDSEIVTATEVSAANAGDAEPATDLLADELPEVTEARAGAGDDGGDDPNSGAGGGAGAPESPAPSGDGPAVYGDSAYGTGPLLARLETAGAQIFTKVQPPNAPGGRFAKDRFIIDLTTGTVTCPGRVSAPIRPAKGGGGIAVFGTTCAGCPLATQCTTSPGGRTITISAYEQQLARARAAQADPAWVAEYKATRPKVERKIGHLMRRRHGGRRARVRGIGKVAADFSLLAAAVNLARLGALGLHQAAGQGWQVAPA